MSTIRIQESHQALRAGPGVDDLSFEVRRGAAGYGIVMLLAASRTTIRRDVA
jgi:hypothetical protein